MIFVDFESILVLKSNGKQNANKSYTNKYQKHVACSYSYELVDVLIYWCVDDKFSKPFKPYVREDAVCNFINSMIKESKYYSEAIIKLLTKNLWWLKRIMKFLRTLLKFGFKNSTMLDLWN